LISGLEKKIALRYLRPKRKEGFLKIISIFSFLGIALGVAVLIIVMSVMNGFRTELLNKILGFNAHIIIKPYDKAINFNDISKLNLANLSESIFSISGEGILINKETTKGILIRGYEKEDISKIEVINKGIIKGSLNDFNNKSVSIGKDLAIDLDVGIGDKIIIMSPSGVSTIIGNLPKQETFLISSIFTSGLSDFDKNIIFLTIEDTKNLFNVSNDDKFLELFLKNPDQIESSKKEIERIFTNEYVYTWADLNKSFFGALKVERNVMFIILSLIIIVAAFNIISGLTILVKNKTKEIAILRSLGVSKNSITKIFFLVGFTIGTFATIFGVILGILFSFYIENIQIFFSNFFNLSLFPEEIYFLSQMPSKIDFNLIILIAFCSIIVTSVASLFPSIKAANLDPIKALKYE
tara:strand:+ start:54 stop:1283 length:1230 start_codon:yes stop_codon:yes gene_type:complete